jgi:AraC-like DNA-binding protein
MFDLSRNALPNEVLYAQGRSYRVNDTILGEYALSGNFLKRTQTRLAVEREDLLVLRMHRGGFTKGTIDERSFEMNASYLTFFDFHQSMNANTEFVDYISFVFPYAAIKYDPSRHPRFLQVPIDSPAGRVLKNNLELMLDIVPNATLSDTLALTEGFCGLMQALLTRELQDETVREKFVHARLVAARRYIDENLPDPNLTADSICKAIGVSRAVLFRMFSEEGGVLHFITRKRMEDALDRLSKTEPKRGAVLEVARSLGFWDQAHFSRLFRDTFGFRPTDVLGSALMLSDEENTAVDESELHATPSVKPLIGIYNPRYPSGLE